MTAEAFIKDKLIPFLEERLAQSTEESLRSDGTGNDSIHYLFCGKALEASTVKVFIEQHRTEWESK